MKRKTIVQGAGWGTSRFLGAVLLGVMLCSMLVVDLSVTSVTLHDNCNSMVNAEFDDCFWCILDRLPWWGWAAVAGAIGITLFGAAAAWPILGWALAGMSAKGIYNTYRAQASSWAAGGNAPSTQWGRDATGFLEKVFSKATGKVYKQPKAMKAAHRAGKAFAGDAPEPGPGPISRRNAKFQKMMDNINKN